jgi:hypothetical protein
MISLLYHEQKKDLLTMNHVHEQMKKPSMKSTRKEERERSCERTSQKPDSPTPVQVSDHERRFRDAALTQSAARRTKGRQGGETMTQKVSQFSESRMN